MPRSRSPPRHGRHGSRSPSPGKHHHGRSHSPKHGHKHDGPKHGHGPKKHDGHGPGRGHGPKHHHGRSKSPRRHDHDVDGPDEEFANKLHIAAPEAEEEPDAEVSAPPPPDAEPERKPEPVVAAAVAAPVMASAAAAMPSADDEEDAKSKFSMTKNFGGEGGSAFDHMNRRRISKISVRAGKFVDGIAITYMNGQRLSNGGDGGEEQSMDLPEGEYVNEVKLREGNVIQSITFITNKGRKLGPCGSGKGHGIGIFAKEGNGVHVKAPNNCRLVGICGREGKWLDAIGFRWGPVRS